MSTISRASWTSIVILVALVLGLGFYSAFSQGFFGQLLTQVQQRLETPELQLTAEIVDQEDGILKVSARYEPLQGLEQLVVPWCVYIELPPEGETELLCREGLAGIEEEYVLPDRVRRFSLRAALPSEYGELSTPRLSMEWTPEIHVRSPLGEEYAVGQSIPYQPALIIRARLQELEASLQDEPLLLQRVVEAQPIVSLMAHDDESVPLSQWLLPLPEQDEVTKAKQLCLRSGGYESCYVLESQESDSAPLPTETVSSVIESEIRPQLSFVPLSDDETLFFTTLVPSRQGYALELQKMSGQTISRVNAGTAAESFLQLVLSPEEDYRLVTQEGGVEILSTTFSPASPEGALTLHASAEEQSEGDVRLVDISWQGSELSTVDIPSQRIYDSSSPSGQFQTMLRVANRSNDEVELNVSLKDAGYSVSEKVPPQSERVIPVQISPLAYGNYSLQTVVSFEEGGVSAPIVYHFRYLQKGLIGEDQLETRIMSIFAGIVLLTAFLGFLARRRYTHPV